MSGGYLKNILVFTYLQRHLNKMIPIIKELQKNNNKVELTVLLMTQEEKAIAAANNICYRMLDEFTDKRRSRDFDLAWGLEPLINAIDEINPDLFLCIEVNNILRNGVRYCKQKGIPSLVVQHGTPNKYSLCAFAPFEGTCFAAWGQFTKDFLVANGVEESRIIITGGAPFDRIRQLRPDRRQIARELHIDPDKKWILFTTQYVGAGNRPSEEEIFTGVASVAEEMKIYEDYELIYQVHPGQTLEEIQKIVDTVENAKAVVARYKDTEELIAASAGMITFFSTTAIDAILMDKPLLLINLTDDRDFYPFVGMGAAFGAYTKDEIPGQVKKLLYEPHVLVSNYSKVKEYINYRNDGRALERVMELCLKMLN